VNRRLGAEVGDARAGSRIFSMNTNQVMGDLIVHHQKDAFMLRALTREDMTA
jgi:hypothetical protein